MESTKQHVNEVMTRLSDQFIQDWFVRISIPEGKKGSNKLRTYKLRPCMRKPTINYAIKLILISRYGRCNVKTADHNEFSFSPK